MKSVASRRLASRPLIVEISVWKLKYRLRTSRASHRGENQNDNHRCTLHATILHLRARSPIDPRWSGEICSCLALLTLPRGWVRLDFRDHASHPRATRRRFVRPRLRRARILLRPRVHARVIGVLWGVRHASSRAGFTMLAALRTAKPATPLSRIENARRGRTSSRVWISPPPPRVAGLIIL